MGMEKANKVLKNELSELYCDKRKILGTPYKDMLNQSISNNTFSDLLVDTNYNKFSDDEALNILLRIEKAINDNLMNKYHIEIIKDDEKDSYIIVNGNGDMIRDINIQDINHYANDLYKQLTKLSNNDYIHQFKLMEKDFN